MRLMAIKRQTLAHSQSAARQADVREGQVRVVTQRPVQFEITEPTRKSVFAWIRHAALKTEDYLFPSRLRLSPHLSTRQYARIVEAWVTEIGLGLGCGRVRNPHHAPHEGIADLPADKEPACSAAAAWSFKAGKHSEIPGDRGRRRTGNGGTNRGLGSGTVGGLGGVGCGRGRRLRIGDRARMGVIDPLRAVECS
jgi:hypothetical protein